jgi:hypothetical protein
MALGVLVFSFLLNRRGLLFWCFVWGGCLHFFCLVLVLGFG